MMTDFASSVHKSIAEGGDLGQILSKLAQSLRVVEEAIALTSSGFRDIAAYAEAGLNSANTAAIGFGNVFRDVLRAVEEGWISLWRGMAAEASAVMQNIEVMAMNFGEGINFAFTGNIEAAGASFSHIGVAAKDAVHAAESAFTAPISTCRRRSVTRKKSIRHQGTLDAG